MGFQCIHCACMGSRKLCYKDMGCCEQNMWNMAGSIAIKAWAAVSKTCGTWPACVAWRLGSGMYLKFKACRGHVMSMLSNRAAREYRVALFKALVYNAYMAQAPQSEPFC